MREISAGQISDTVSRLFQDACLYLPDDVVAAIRKESGKWKWPAFLALYTTALAWIAAFLVYQVGGLF